MSKLQTAHDNLVALIEADARPAGVAAEDWPLIFANTDPKKKIGVITESVGDIAVAVAKQLQSIKIGVVVMLPAINYEGSGLLMAPKFAVAVTANPFNKTGSSSLDVIERIVKLVHRKPTGVTVGDEVSLFTLDRNAVQQLPPPRDAASVLTHIISINTETELT